MISLNQKTKIKEYSLACKWTDNDGYWSHTLEVVKHASWLQSKFGGNIDIIEVAAYLHDIGKSKGRLELKDRDKENHYAVSAQMARFFLKEIKLTNEEIDEICSAILESHSGINSWPKNIEEQIIACADKMAILTDSEKARRWYGKELSNVEILKIIDIFNDVFNHIKNSPFKEAVEQVVKNYEIKIKNYKNILIDI
jgi:putative nucleotidyltransferase with HDIG domain